MKQDIRYCRSRDGTRIAYSVVGSGPLLVLVGGWRNIGHLELEWEVGSSTRPLFERLAARHTLVRFDSRGTGLSSRGLDEVSLTDFVDDLAAVIEALGQPPHLLIGHTTGAAAAIEYVATRNTKPAGVVLYAASADGEGITETREALESLMSTFWRIAARTWSDWFVPSRMSDVPFRMRFAEEVQGAATSEVAVKIFNLQHDFSVRRWLSSFPRPALLMTPTRGVIMPVRLSEELADALPDARFIGLPTEDDLPVEQGDIERVASYIEAFSDELLAAAADRSAPPPAPKLSARELEVLHLVAAGLTNQAIAERLTVSTHTVNRHVANLLRKLDAANRTQAVALARELRLLP